MRAVLLASLLLLGADLGVADEVLPAKKAIPPANHFSVTMPGASWLNVSRPLATDDLSNKIVLLDFWTYCCVNCIQTIPELAKLEKEFKDVLVVIGVHSAKFDTEKETDQIRQAVLRYGIEHPVVNDRDFRIWRSFNVRAWPTLVLLNPNGEVVKQVSGEGHIEELRAAIQDLKKANPKRTRGGVPILLEREKVARGEFFYPSKLAYDEASKTLFVADSSHHQIAAYTWDSKQPARLKPLYRVGKAGEEGLTNGSFSAARFRRPQGIVASKGALYVADTENHVLRKIDLKSKTVSTIAGTGKKGSAKEMGKSFSALSVPLASPWDVAFHPDADHLVVAMAGAHQLWSLDLKSQKISVMAGNGAEAIDDGMAEEKSNLAQPSGVSSLLGSLYFVDSETSSLRFFFEGYVRTLVGKGLFEFGFKDGERKSAKLQHPLGLYADVTGIYIADSYNHSIRRYDPAKQMMETVMGDGKAGEGAEKAPELAARVRLNEPSGILKLNDSTMIVSDTNNHRLVVWNLATGKVERMKVEGEKPSESGLKEDTAVGTPMVASKKRMSIRLPNTLPLPSVKIKPDGKIRIVLPPRFKMNAEGPSFAHLFVGEPPKESLLQEWKRDDLKSSLLLSPNDLKIGSAYLFQGTFYFCMDEKNAVCEIASVSFPVVVDPLGVGSVDVPISSGAPSQ